MSPRVTDLIAAAAFAGYCWNVLAGKAAVVAGIDLPRVGDVGEFLLLLTACAAFVTGTLQREARRARAWERFRAGVERATGAGGAGPAAPSPAGSPRTAGEGAAGAP